MTTKHQPPKPWHLKSILALSGTWIVSGSMDNRTGRITLRNW